MKKTFFSLLLVLTFSQTLFAQNIEVIVPTLKEGALYNYWWMEEDKKIEKFKTTNLHSKMKQRGLDFLARPTNEKVWSKFDRGSAYYFFFTNVKNPIKEKFLIQRVKKVVALYKDGESQPYSKKVTYLVEAFKTWVGYPQVEGTIKRADGHDAIFSSIGRRKTKVVYKEFETGVGTIDGIAEDNTIWPFDARSLYFGTKYDERGAELYDKVKFSDSDKWTLNVEVKKDGYLIESPELGISIRK